MKSAYAGQYPPYLDSPAAVLARVGNSTYIYVFGGRYISAQGYVTSRTLFSYDMSKITVMHIKARY
jgi:hypothetical protein